MTSWRLSTFIDALAAGRRPGHFRADPEDVAIVRAAIALRAARPGEAAPDERFVSDLQESLAEQGRFRVGPDTPSVTTRRWRAALAAVAAGVVLVAGTTTIATEAFNHGAAPPAAVQPPQGNLLRTGTFKAADSRVLGQIVAYRGHPSWVFMNVNDTRYDGPIVCKLQLDDGSTAAIGGFELHRGIGEFSRTVQVDIGRLRGAKLLTPTGAIVASATFL
jgi:hypothetical protein